MYGKGVYFADMSGKSAPYCCAHLSNNIGLFILCEVALGQTKDYYSTAPEADLNLPKDCQSSRCIGRYLPDPKKDTTIEKNITVPLGPKINNPDKNAQRSHDEFIIYNTQQAQIKYMCMVKFEGFA